MSPGSEQAPLAAGAPALDWRPTASLDNLRTRADLLARTRAFFAARGVLEVDTPALAAAPVTDPHIACIEAQVLAAAGQRRRLYLQSSPEFAMKRLLAAGAGPIYQLGKAFRDGESGTWHATEFTMLEWYRPGFDDRRLALETTELLSELSARQRAGTFDHGELFAAATGLDPHQAEDRQLAEQVVSRCGMSALSAATLQRADLIDLLFERCVQPGLDGIAVVHDFPACQAALARLRDGRAARFEVFIDGIEVANGYHELEDAAEQRRRARADLDLRARSGLPQVPVDERLLAALEAGLGDVAGVAVGFDRVVALSIGASGIEPVIAFAGAAA